MWEIKELSIHRQNIFKRLIMGDVHIGKQNKGHKKGVNPYLFSPQKVRPSTQPKPNKPIEHTPLRCIRRTYFF